MKRHLLSLALVALVAPPLALAQAENEKLRNAKALFLDRQYGEARTLLQSVRSSGSAEAQQALYWIARCSESLGEHERALGEYGEFLASRPADRTLAEEARTSRIALAVKLARTGTPRRDRTQYLGLAREALADPSRTVRYFAALQLASLGPAHGRAAVPVLKEILAKESDSDLVDRAKLYLVRLDPGALSGKRASSARGGPVSGSTALAWIRVRIYEKGKTTPQLAINLPVALAEMVFEGLPADTKKELQHEGYDAGSFWERLKKTGPTDILTIEGDDGGRIQVWIE
jgi:hypothetical protein